MRALQGFWFVLKVTATEGNDEGIIPTWWIQFLNLLLSWELTVLVEMIFVVACYHFSKIKNAINC